MKIVFSSLVEPASFLPITLYDRTDWFNFFNEHPVQSQRLQRTGERVVFLTHVENLKALPNKELLQTDLPNEDGRIHYSAIFKPSPFFIGCDLEPGNVSNLLLELFQIRGAFKMVIYDNNGVTSTLNVVSRNMTEGVIELENTDLSVDKVQESVKYFYVFAGENNLYPLETLFPRSDLFPMNTSTYGMSDNGSTPFYIAEKTDYLLEFENTTSVPLIFRDIIINGVSWNAPDTTINPTEKIMFANNPSNYPYDTPENGKIYKYASGTFTQIGTFDTKLIQNNNSIMVDFGVSDDSVVDGYMTFMAFSKGTSVVPG